MKYIYNFLPQKFNKYYLYYYQFFALYFHEIKCSGMYNLVVLCNLLFFFKETINSHFIAEIIPSEAYRRWGFLSWNHSESCPTTHWSSIVRFNKKDREEGGRRHFRHLSIPCFPPILNWLSTFLHPFVIRSVLTKAGSISFSSLFFFFSNGHVREPFWPSVSLSHLPMWVRVGCKKGARYRWAEEEEASVSSSSSFSPSSLSF